MQLHDPMHDRPAAAPKPDEAWPTWRPLPAAPSPHRLSRRVRSDAAPAAAETLVERAYARLRSTLILGKIAPGQRITLGALARELGTSVTPVRNALARLASTDALQQSREAGVIMPILGQAEMAELLRLRLAVEQMALSNAWAHHRAADWRGFRLPYANLRRSAEGADAAAFAGAVWEFRTAILGLSRSSMLAMLVDRIWCRLGPTFTQGLADLGRRRQLVALFDAIVSAIARDDFDRARRAVVAEIEAGTVLPSAAPTEEAAAPPLVPVPAAAVREETCLSGASHV